MLAPHQIGRITVTIDERGDAEISFYIHPLRRGAQNLKRYCENMFKKRLVGSQKASPCFCKQPGIDMADYQRERILARGSGIGLVIMVRHIVERLLDGHDDLPRDIRLSATDFSMGLWSSTTLSLLHGFQSRHDRDTQRRVATLSYKKTPKTAV